MPRSPEPLPEDLGEVFSCAAASASGVSPKRLRAADLDTPFRGVRRKRGTEDAVASGPLADDQDVRCRVLDHARAYAQIMDGRAFFCGRTAAVLWGTSARSSRELEVGVIAPARAPRRHGIRGRQLAPTHVEVASLGGGGRGRPPPHVETPMGARHREAHRLRRSRLRGGAAHLGAHPTHRLRGSDARGRCPPTARLVSPALTALHLAARAHSRPKSGRRLSTQAPARTQPSTRPTPPHDEGPRSVDRGPSRNRTQPTRTNS